MLSPTLRLSALAAISVAVAGALVSVHFLIPSPPPEAPLQIEEAGPLTPATPDIEEVFEPERLQLTPPSLPIKESGAAALFRASTITPPAPSREFRAAWIATVGNIDWPSKPGLSPEAQRAELIALLDRAEALRLNAIVLQVRPASDALYASSLEPWSAYLTGRMGEAPSPFYDPLEFAVTEAHKRGLELHAWFNPFRALTTVRNKAGTADNHISRTQPEIVRRYGDQLWLDPGEPAARNYVLNVIADVVKRYDIDAVHLDDYFYPYAVKDRRGRKVDFPDDSSWKDYRTSGGTLARDDWRRDNVNTFVRNLYHRIKDEKKWVKLGISPFGIWRPQKEPLIAGLDAFAEIYADSKTWLQQGWIDYLSPQLYWGTDAPRHSYPVLLKWWSEANSLNRHLWPGIATGKIGKERPASDILNQISLTRRNSTASGNIHWHFKSLLQNVGQISDELSKTLYAQPALVPAFSWLGDTAPGKPLVNFEDRRMAWSIVDPTHASRWALQTRRNGEWSLEVLPGNATSRLFEGADLPEAISITAVDRLGNVGPSSVFELAELPTEPAEELEPAAL